MTEAELWREQYAPAAAHDWWHGLTDDERIDLFDESGAGQDAYDDFIEDLRRGKL